MAFALRDQMQADLTAALRARDGVRVSVLRCTLAALANAEALAPAAAPDAPRAGLLGDVARRVIDEREATGIIARERAELQVSAAEMRALGQSEEADRLLAQALVLDRYLRDV